VYYYRSGSTKQELKGTALQHFLLKKIGKTWGDIPVPYATLNDMNENTIKSFGKKAFQKGRISEVAAQADIGTLLKNIRSINEDGQLTNAALLLFDKNPTRHFVTASFKIGRFGDGIQTSDFRI
jgi:ATP-dependent DNA helicase RecG